MAHLYHYFYIGDNILSGSDFEKQSPLLLSFSKIQNGSKSEVTMHMHTHLEVFYFESGSGMFECDHQTIPIKAHDIFIANAQSLHQQYSDTTDEPLTYYNFEVGNLHIRGMPTNCISANAFEHYSLNDGENYIYRTILLMLQEMREKQYNYFFKTNALFSQMLVDVIRLFHTEAVAVGNVRSAENRKLLAQVKSYIETHFAEDLNLDCLTRISIMQKSYFLQQFKKMYGISPVKYLNLVRIENAKFLLTSSDKTVTEIAAEVGFNNPSYLSEMFFKIVGVSPTAYRKLKTERS